MDFSVKLNVILILLFWTEVVDVACDLIYAVVKEQTFIDKPKHKFSNNFLKYN